MHETKNVHIAQPYRTKSNNFRVLLSLLDPVSQNLNRKVAYKIQATEKLIKGAE